MMSERNILYIHGMGGGGDSRIPAILKEHSGMYSPTPAGDKVNIIIRTYDFDPEIASVQINSWLKEYRPSLVIGESLGSLHAIRVEGIPHILISPSLNAPLYLGNLAFLACIPGVTCLLDRIYRPKEGDRQKLHFTYEVLKKYKNHRSRALRNSTVNGSSDFFFAFFGENDHYRRSGIVNIGTYRRYFGDSYATYSGTHFMEEEYILSMLIPKIMEIL